MLTATENTLQSAAPRFFSDALERGELVFFPQTPVPLPSLSDLDFLRSELPARLSRKNVSYYPVADKLRGVEGDEAAAARVRALLKRRSESVQRFLSNLMPELTAGWTVGTTSFRPLQEKGRNLSPHASNELVHVDAGAYGATHGDRILRFFTNVHPSEDRVWITKGTFAELYQRYGETAGIPGPHQLDSVWMDRVVGSVVKTATRAGVRLARMVDTSRYDRVMRRFHNFMKDTPSFQEDPTGHEEFAFPPFSSWMVLTDTRSHACISGQHAFVDTFIIRLAACRVRETAPYYLLQQGLARASAA
ncbi:MAG TPA: Kdo hydroxylase family protein [Myxococcaceae bacterium]|nr:Kdo hydroxylase family protein [Myxococcaceae bacterium]